VLSGKTRPLPHTTVYSSLIIYAIRRAFSALQLRSLPTSPELELLSPKGEGDPHRISDPSSRFEPPVASVSRPSTSLEGDYKFGALDLVVSLQFILGQRYPVQLYFDMETEETKDYLKNVDWKTLGNNVTNDTGPVAKKRLPKKLRQVPDYYFLPRRSLSSALALSALVCAAGVGAGMLVEVWINKKIQEDGGVIWELDKK
ncbi:hypothetical protein Taro_047094, partial [Colocasia esculenta]|nr:hypothetical protein [Colocasia esculenta]